MADGPHGERGGSGRVGSGSGGQVVSYQDLASLDVDHYDFINAPQYVDFAHLDKTDDPNADIFFENHREEDDFLISIDNISPTMQLLQEQQNNDANVLDSIAQEVNNAVAKDGMNDVQVVYYASPATSVGSNANNKGRNTNSLNSSNSCFYTPMGARDTGDKEYHDDKENCAPSLNTPEFKDPVKKLSYSAAFDEDDDTPIQEFICKNTGNQDEQQNMDKYSSSSYCDSYTPSTGLLAQLGKLQILSSDEEDAAVEITEESYSSPTKSITTDEALVNSLLKTPGATSVLTKSNTPAIKIQDNPEPKPYNVLITKIAHGGVGKLTIPHSPDASKRRNFASVPSKCRNVGNIGNSALAKLASASMKNESKKKPAPIPFKPTGAPKLPMKADHQLYVSLAEQISKFQKNTPDRFRTLPRGRTGYLQRSNSCEFKPPTQNGRNSSKSPNRPQKTALPTVLVRRNRASSVSMSKTNSLSTSNRPSSAMSSKSSGASILHRTTIPQPFHFSTTRTRNPSSDTKKDVPEFKFKARPAPKTQGQVGVHERPQIKVTLPVAPHFASDDRIRERNVKKAQSATQSPTRSTTSQTRPSRIPVVGGPRIPSMDPPHKITALKPFSFDQRNQEMLRRKEEKIKQEIEEETRIPEFHANPLPKFEQKLPKKRPAPATHIEPFNFKSDQRGSSYQQALKLKLDEDEREFRAMTTFYANPPNVLHQPAFEPEHSGRPPLETLDFQLNTEKRAVERQQFDSFLRQKELEEEQKRQEDQLRLNEQHRLEEIERRRQMVHKAQPFKAPKPFELKASGKPLTIPQSPAFHPLPSQRRTTPTKNSSM